MQYQPEHGFQSEHGSAYRPDIDGLRALAIIPVVLFHANVPGFTGGFIGVDVFFVISGFLITSIIHSEIQRGDFSIVRFYERRARRILPAFFLVMACCVFFSFWLLFPRQYKDFSRVLVAAALFVSSITLERDTGYFDLDSEEKPLLHTWSLSVEEIYYIFFPLIMLAVARFLPRREQFVLLFVGCASLLGSAIVLTVDSQSTAAFFLPHLRAWELVIGALLAVFNTRMKLPQTFLDVLALCGLAMIVVPIFVYSNETTFPGFAALVPCVGAALVIFSGQYAPTAAGRLLSLPVFVFFGLISYSLYLWHWPLLVFARQYVGQELAAWQSWLVVVLSIGLAAFSTRFVEKPFRGRSSKISRRQVFAFSLIGILLFVGIGIHGDVSKGWTARYPAKYKAIFDAFLDKDPRQKECLNPKMLRGCVYGDQEVGPKHVLWGDSLAAHYADMLGDVAKKFGKSIQVFTLPACPPARNWVVPGQRWRKDCAEFQSRTFEKVTKSESLETVILAGHLRAYVDAKNTSGFPEALAETIKGLKEAGKEVAIVYPLPEFRSDFPDRLSDLANRRKMPKTFGINSRIFNKRNQELTALLDRLADQWDLIRIKPAVELCDSEKCYFYRNKTVYFIDQIHLTRTGALDLAPLFEPLFK